MSYPTLGKAPIKEALLDIRVNLPQDTELANLADLQKSVNDRFPDKVPWTQYSSNFQLGKSGETSMSTSKKEEGFHFISKNKEKIFQAKIDGFTFNRLPPYEDWGKFSNEAKELWELYAAKVKPLNITRLALRYINRIELPLPVKDFKDFLTTVPEISPTLPQDMSNLFMRVVISDDGNKNTANIIETIEPAVDQKVLPLIFDIDVYREITLEPDSSEIWKIFESLRDFKNKIFFESLTDKTKEMFR